MNNTTFKIQAEGASIRITNEKSGSYFALVYRNGDMELHQRAEGREAKYMGEIQTMLRKKIKGGMDKRMSYKQRFEKVASAMRELTNKAVTYQVLRNKIVGSLDSALTA